MKSHTQYTGPAHSYHVRNNFHPIIFFKRQNRTLLPLQYSVVRQRSVAALGLRNLTNSPTCNTHVDMTYNNHKCNAKSQPLDTISLQLSFKFFFWGGGVIF